MKPQPAIYIESIDFRPAWGLPGNRWCWYIMLPGKHFWATQEHSSATLAECVADFQAVGLAKVALFDQQRDEMETAIFG